MTTAYAYDWGQNSRKTARHQRAEVSIYCARDQKVVQLAYTSDLQAFCPACGDLVDLSHFIVDDYGA